MEGIFTKAELNTVRPPDPVLPLCGKCNLFRGCRSPKMPVSGNGRRGILLVGEAPGATEDRDGVQFVGEAGRLLQKTLRRAGIDMREDCWLTNALSCRPPDNKVPNEKMVEYCRPLVMRAIEELRPDVIVPLGARAIKSVVGHLWRDDVGEVRRWTGFRIPSARWSAWVCPTYHPSHILRNWDRDRNRSDNPVEDMVFERDLKAVAGLDGPPPTPPDYDKIVEVIQDPARAADRIAQTMNAGEVAFDYETTCLRPDGPDAEIVCCSVGTPTDAFAFPWTGETRLAASRLLRCREVKKVGWNVKMEDRWTRAKLGFPVAGWAWDGMIAAHALDARGSAGDGAGDRRKGRGITGLKFQTFVRLGVEDYSSSVAEYMKADGTNAPNRLRELMRRDPRRLLRYNALDSLFTAIVCEQQRKEVY